MYFTNYAAPKTPQEALALLEKKRNRVVGGNLWLKMSSLTGETMVDLTQLGWDKIEETEESYLIGAMVSLRQLELHEGLNRMTGGLFASAFRPIVGVQFRNAATVGGSLSMRSGFSEVLTAFLPLQATVLLEPGEEIPLVEYAMRKPGRELIRGIRIPRQALSCAYQAIRNTSGNLPLLTCCVAADPRGFSAAIGARPHRAKLLHGETAEELMEQALALDYGTNAAATGTYRRHLAQVLLSRCLENVQKGDLK